MCAAIIHLRSHDALYEKLWLREGCLQLWVPTKEEMSKHSAKIKTMDCEAQKKDMGNSLKQWQSNGRHVLEGIKVLVH